MRSRARSSRPSARDSGSTSTSTPTVAPPRCDSAPRSTWASPPPRSERHPISGWPGGRRYSCRHPFFSWRRNVALVQAPTRNARLLAWVDEMVHLCQPDSVHWFDGSDAEHELLCKQLVDAGTFTELDPEKRPGSYWAHSDPSDVARVEDRTFICSAEQADAGPTNNWKEPEEMRSKLDELFRGCMQGRTMYVVPFSMGPLGSSLSYIGVEITDSPYVAVSMRTMTRAGQAALDVLRSDGEVVPCVHSVGAPPAAGWADGPWPGAPAAKGVRALPEP